MRSLRRMSWIGIALLLGCNGGGELTVTGGDADGAGSDVSRADAPVAAETTDLPDPFDGSGPDLAEPDLQVDVSGCAPGEGCFLDPCLENEDCLSGWCVEHMGGSVCTAPCAEDCPEGWSCMQVATEGREVFLLCVSDVPTLCRPCAFHADCKVPGGVDVACVDYGAEAGSFCGAGCTPASPDGDADSCPAGYGCQEVPTVDGLLQFQCVPDEGECACTPKSVTAGLGTPCEVVNEHGICGGFRVCGAEGLSACDAAVPAAES